MEAQGPPLSACGDNCWRGCPKQGCLLGKGFNGGPGVAAHPTSWMGQSHPSWEKVLLLGTWRKGEAVGWGACSPPTARHAL